MELPRIVVGPYDGDDGRGHTSAGAVGGIGGRAARTGSATGRASPQPVVLAQLRFLAEAVPARTGSRRGIICRASAEHEPGRRPRGGVLGSGSSYALVMNHELGHCFGLPHLGEITQPRSANEANVFPYTGEFLNGSGEPQGGAFGRTWAYDPVDGTLVPPTCASTGKEMQDPMQRREACVKEGRLYDFFSDYSAHRIARYFAGGEAYTGRVPYRGETVPFGFPRSGGREELTDPDASPPTFRKWDAATGRYADVAPDPAPAFDSQRPIAKAPVYLVHGSFNFTSDETSVVYPPVLYRGYTRPTIDLTQAADFAALKANGGAAANGADLTVRATYEDGTVRHFLLRAPVRNERDNPLSNDGFRTFGVNVPADKKLVEANDLPAIAVPALRAGIRSLF